MQKELLSAYMDGEEVSAELTEQLCQDKDSQESWAAYHTVRSVMRKESPVLLGSDFTAKNYLTAQGRRPPSEDILAEDAEGYDVGTHLRDVDTPENEMLSSELEKVVFDTIHSLPEDLRTAITLRELEGLSYEEIAEIMDCPVGTVRSRIFRAREVIENKIQPLMQR